MMKCDQKPAHQVNVQTQVALEPVDVFLQPEYNVPQPLVGIQAYPARLRASKILTLSHVCQRLVVLLHLHMAPFTI